MLIIIQNIDQVDQIIIQSNKNKRNFHHIQIITSDLMKFSELIDMCIECVKTFNPVINTIDSHADNFLSGMKDPYEKVFVKQIFYGCIRYQDFLKVFTTVFFKRHPVGTNRNDIVMYQVFSYLSFFRLEELAIEDYRKLILSQDAVKMHIFLQFQFNAEEMREHVRELWMDLYDYQYIDDKIIGGIEKNLPNVGDILRIVERKATGKNTSGLSASGVSQSNMSETQSQATTQAGGTTGGRQSAMSGTIEGEFIQKPLTQQKPFNLTKPKPKVIPQPEALLRETKANPVPKNLFKTSVVNVEKDKEERRKAKTETIRKEYEDNSKKRFELATEARPAANKFEQTKEEYEAKFQAKLIFEGTKARKMPDFDKVEAPVKLTAAAVKREALALKKAQEEEEKRLKDLEWNQRDETEFVTWKREMDQRDEIIHLDYIQRKKIEMELCREQAIIAQEQKALDNKINAKNMKIESHTRLDEREKNLKEEFEKRVVTVEQVHSQKDKAAESMAVMKAENRELRNQINKEMHEASKRMKDEEEYEHRRKQELIRQIRELEKIPIVRTKGFDPTEAGGHGLLEEMSIAELRERIEYNKREVEQQCESKRQDNLQRKDQEAEDLINTAHKIQEARNVRKVQNDQRREQKVKEAIELEERKKQIREQGLIEAYEKINKKKKDKKAEDERLAKELKEIRLQRQYMNANAAMVEEKAWKELEAGAERQIRNNQNERLIEQCGLNGIAVKDQTVRATNKKNEVIEKLMIDKAYEDKLDIRKKENELLHKNTMKSH